MYVTHGTYGDNFGVSFLLCYVVIGCFMLFMQFDWMFKLVRFSLTSLLLGTNQIAGNSSEFKIDVTEMYH